MEGIELKSFQIISAVGTAKSCFVEAMRCARKGEFEKALTLIEEGETELIQGQQVHLELIQEEASGNKVGSNLILIHAEDQMMSAETIKICAVELIESYKQIYELKERVL